VIWSLLHFVTTAALVVSAALLSASSGLRSLPAFVLAVYVIAYGELVLLVALLSIADFVVRWALVGGVAVLLAAGVATWVFSGRPRAPALMPALRTLRSALRDPPLAILAGAVVLGFAYLTALALFTPANSIDALWYHLTRAALWKQEHGVGYIADVNDTRLNGNPPVGEIGLLYTMIVSGTDRFVTLVALAAYAVLPITVFGTARRLSVETRPALCAALVFATLPVALLHAPAAKNDLVLAVFAAACVYFCLGTRAFEAVLACVALALALGTKIFAPLFLPIIALIVVVGTPRRRALLLAAAAVPAIVVGSTWNFVNLAHTDSSVGELSDASGESSFGILAFTARTARYLINFLEIPGAAGWWFAGYVVAALALAALLVRNRRSWSRTSVVAAAALGLIPLVAISLGPLANRGYGYLLFHLGRPELGILDYRRDVYLADLMSTYYGPLGLAVLASLVVLLRRRHLVPRVAIALAAAPLLLVFGIVFVVGYSGTSGRFFLFAVALAVAAAALLLTSRAVTWAVVALAVPTLVLTLRANVEKPTSVWGKPRWLVQTLLGPNNDQVRVIRYTAESLPRDVQLGLALGRYDVSYPFFDSHLRRRVRFVSSTQALPSDLDWLVLSPDRLPPRGSWREILRTPGGWRVYER
jgi:hypothetical protein